MAMSGPSNEERSAEEQRLREEVARLKQMVQVLMDRAERSTSLQASEFGLFQSTIVLEELVQRRTEELSEALERNEKITRELRESEARFRGLADQSLVGIAIIDDDRFAYVNSRFAETFGYSREEIETMTPLQLVADSSQPVVSEHVRRLRAGEPRENLLGFQGRKKNGHGINIELSSSRMHLGNETMLIFVAADVTARVLAERKVHALNLRLAEQAIHDPLTGLYNRRFMVDSLDRELMRAKRDMYPVSVVMCDLDHFKAINDRYGHLAGDKVLKAFGSLLKRYCRGSDIASRYGGEEFLLVFPNMPGIVARGRAEALRAATAKRSVKSGDEIIEITASFGVATYPIDGQTPDEIISSADDAQYQAKARGRNQVRCACDLEKD